MFDIYMVTICTSKFFALKTDALYLFKKSEQTFRFETYYPKDIF